MNRLLIKLYKKLLYGYKSSSESYKKYLKKKGVSLGENVTFYEPSTNYIDIQKPFLITIGNNVEITRGVVIITHDYSWAIFKQIHNEIIGCRKKVVIGNNVFIGLNSIIMKGVRIGNNVVIGANSVVTKDIPDNSVVCGNPARVISNIEDMYEKRKKAYQDEAVEMFVEYYKKYNKIPPKDIFDEFFWIFEERDSDIIEKSYLEKLKLTGNYESTMKKFKLSIPMFNGYKEFSAYCIKEKIRKGE